MPGFVHGERKASIPPSSAITSPGVLALSFRRSPAERSVVIRSALPAPQPNHRPSSTYRSSQSKLLCHGARRPYPPPRRVQVGQILPNPSTEPATENRLLMVCPPPRNTTASVTLPNSGA